MTQPDPPPERPPARNALPPVAGTAAPAQGERPPPMQRLHPWIDLIAKMLTALAAALAIWKGLR